MQYKNLVVITNGDLNVVTKALVVDIGARFLSVDDAVAFFASETGTPVDEVVANPVGEPGDV